MKRRIWVVGGSIGAGVILVLAMLTTVVSAQTIKSTVDEKTRFIQNILNKKDKVASGGIIQLILALLKNWFPGYIFYWIGFLIFAFIIFVTASLSGHLFY